uniref:EOG090X0AV2 n=1 Tax=Daphnia magna TaxID=35525 RepID=A0A4Y7MSB5_9CRUS|nr:EOG090X0AV2 [Daphnia magna]
MQQQAASPDAASPDAASPDAASSCAAANASRPSSHATIAPWTRQPPVHIAQPPMTMPLFDENADDAPAVAMEYKVHVDPGKEECYFQFVQKGATIYVSFQVLRGGDGMAGFAVRNPSGQLVHPYQWKPASEFQEVSPTGGYYGICVDNQFSRFAAKLVNLYITTFRYDQWEKFTQELKDIDVSAENCTNILQGVDKRIQGILQMQQLARSREARDYNLLLDNETYVQNWSIAQCVVVIACFVVQVYFVKKLFETKSGGRGRI